MLSRIITRLALPLLLLVAWAAPVIAQTAPKVEKILKPASPPVGKADTSWWAIILAFVLVGLIVGVNFIPSKRGHQD